MLFNKLLEHKVVAIFRGIDQELATKAAEALINGGVRFIEVTLNTASAEGLIRHWRNQFSDKAYVGAGTVIDLEAAERAVAAGAQFLISPNFDREVLEYAKQHNVDVWPGVTTPTEIVQAWTAGARMVKLFPLASLGVSYLQEIKAPLDHIPIMATGGVTLANVTEYLEAGADALGVGSELVNKRLITAGEWDQLRENAAIFIQAVKSFKQSS